MPSSIQDISGLVFRQRVQSDIRELSLNGKMLIVLLQFDGKKSLGRVARQAELSLTAIRPIVSRLLKARLIEQVKRAVETADSEFIEALVSRLSIAIGPLGSFVVDDGLELMGFDRTTLPAHRAAELVTLASHDIPRQEKKRGFIQDMDLILRQKGYR